MTNEFEFLSFDQQLDQLFESRPTLADSQTPSPTHHEFTTELDQFNDSIAVRSFLNSVHTALGSNDEATINVVLGVLISSDKHPHLKNAVHAFTGLRYRSARVAAQMALEQAINDTSVAHHFAYCAATLVIAHSNLHLGDDIGVVDALLKCKKYLLDKIGVHTELWVNEVFDRFLPNWGSQRHQVVAGLFS